MADGHFTFAEYLNHWVIPLFLVLISVFFIACGNSGLTIREAPEKTEQEVPEDTTATDENKQKEQELEQQRLELEQAYEEELSERYQGRANSITTYYNNAQRLFYLRNFQAALYHINKAAEIRETSDILALRGSIYLALGSKEKFAENWRMALDLDEDVPIPNVDFVINELKALGLINQNRKPGN